MQRIEVEARERLQLVPREVRSGASWSHQVAAPAWPSRRNRRVSRGLGRAMAERRQPERSRVRGEVAAKRVG